MAKNKSIEEDKLTPAQWEYVRMYAERLKERRIAANFKTVGDAAKLASIGRNTWTRWEDPLDPRTPQIAKSLTVAEILNTSQAYLSGEIDDPRPLRVIREELNAFFRLRPQELDTSQTINTINQSVNIPGPLESDNPEQQGGIPFYVTPANPHEPLSNDEIELIYKMVATLDQKLVLMGRLQSENERRRRERTPSTDLQDEPEGEPDQTSTPKE